MKQEIINLIFTALDNLGIKRVAKDSILLDHPANLEHGDYSTNIAMVAFAKLKTEGKKIEMKSPLELAQLVSQEILNLKSKILKSVDALPPGFINFKLKPEILIVEAEKQVESNRLKKEISRIGKGKTMVIDYSAPNIAKPFGIGHLRSTNIGQAIYNLYHFLGWRTIGDNHLGDWGTQFGKLIYQIKLKAKSRKLTINDLEKLYIEFHKEAEKNPRLEGEARKWFKKLEEGDKEAKEIWQTCVDISLAEFDRVYKLLGVKIDKAYGESFYHFEGWMDKVLGDVKEKGLLKESQGALVIKIPGRKLPAMLVKSDGATTYLLRDLATIKFRVETWRPDLIVYEVGADQELHFQQIFTVAEMLGYISKEKLVHVPHGLIRWKEGKFSTRKGITIHLEEVINEGLKKAGELISEGQNNKELIDAEKKTIAKTVAIGGIKFNDLKQEPERDIIFDWEKIVSLDGYSAPYLQYTYARCASVLAKAGINPQPATRNLSTILPSNNQMTNEEMALLRIFYQFPEVIVEAAEKFSPHILCQYLFSLAQKFNLFYQKHRILIENDQISKFRVFLTQVTANILKTGLELLGIEVLERM